MTVKVLFFAGLKDYFGESEKQVEIKESVTVIDLWKRLSSSINSVSVPLLFAVNENYVKGSYVLKDKDTVAFMTPVAGG